MLVLGIVFNLAGGIWNTLAARQNDQHAQKLIDEIARVEALIVKIENTSEGGHRDH